MQLKQVSQNLAFKDADIKLGIVTGYLSEFNTIDSDEDLIQKSSYAKTIQESGPSSRKPRIKYLQDHNKSKCVGVFTILKEDNTGLYYEAKLGSHDAGVDYGKMCESGIITEHSVGFEAVKETKMDGYNLITEIKLWEGSGLQTWGANSNTPLTGIKSEKLLQKFHALEKALKNGSFTDQTMIELQAKYDEIDMILKQLEQSETTPEIINPVRERIELKYMQYGLVDPEKKDQIEFLQEIEYHAECLAGVIGKGLVKTATKQYSNILLPYVEQIMTQVEKMEDAIAGGKGIMEEEPQENNNDTYKAENTKPLGDTLPNLEEKSESFKYIFNELNSLK